MTPDALNASLVSSDLTGFLQGEIAKFIKEGNIKKAHEYTKTLVRAYTNLEFNSACHQWLREWNQQLEIYEKLRTK